MKIQYYGTGAGAGIPEIFCSCRVCNDARERRGKNIRTRSQAVIDDRLSIEFPVDTFLHTVYGGLDMRKIRHVLITHNHHDHFLPQDVLSRPVGYDEPVCFYSGERSIKGLKKMVDALEEAYRSGTRIRTCNFRVECKTLQMYEPVAILDYEVIPLRARHAEDLDGLNFIIRSGEKHILWAHDTGLFHTVVWEYLKQSEIAFDFVSLDCTLKRGVQITKSHMDLDGCRQTAERLRKQGNLKEHAIIALSHIGHLVERTHDELEAEAAEYGMIVAYDGMVMEI